jgi:hypothetical protein
MTRAAAWLRKLVEAYFDPSLHTDLCLDDDDPTDPDYVRADALISQVFTLPYDAPEDCWLFLQIACDLSLADDQLGLLGAGVFEDLMDEHGHAFIERVESAVIANAAMRDVVDGAWTMSMEPLVAQRVEAIQSRQKARDNQLRRQRWEAQQGGGD